MVLKVKQLGFMRSSFYDIHFLTGVTPPGRKVSISKESLVDLSVKLCKVEKLKKKNEFSTSTDILLKKGNYDL